MTVEAALELMAFIDSHADGTEARAALVESLHRKLIESPETFWEEFFELLNPDNPVRELAKELLRSGAVNEETTIADIPAIFAWHEMTQKRRRR